MSRTSSVRRQVLGALGVTAVAVGVILGGGSATATSRSPSSPKYFGYINWRQHTETSTGQGLYSDFSASQSSGPGGNFTSFAVTLEEDVQGRIPISARTVNSKVTKKVGTESHSWNFPVPKTAFTVGSKGKAALKVPPAKLKPYGVAKLKFTPSGKAKKQTCSASVYVVTQKVKVSGVLYFDTRSTGKHKWGHIGSKHKRTTFKALGTRSFTYGQQFAGCGGSPSVPCAKTLTWSASNQGTSVALNGGAVTKKRGYLSGYRSLVLSKPKKASRTDSVQATVPAPKLTMGGGGSATMSVGTSGGLARGSANLMSSAPGSSFAEQCGNGKTQTFADWQSALKNGKPALELTEDIFGPIKLANGSTGSINSTSG